MADALSRVNKAKAELLEDGESYLAAARVWWKAKGVSPVLGVVGAVLSETTRADASPDIGGKMTDQMIWACSDRRLFMWRTDNITAKRPTKLIAALTLKGQVVGSVFEDQAAGAGPGKARLYVSVGETTMRVEGKKSDLKALADAIEGPPDTELYSDGLG